MAILIETVVTALTVVVLADVLVSFVLSPFHPIRQTLDSLVAPLLAPIRRVLPPVGMLDFSPLVLLILVQLVGSLLVSLFSSI